MLLSSINVCVLPIGGTFIAKPSCELVAHVGSCMGMTTGNSCHPRQDIPLAPETWYDISICQWYVFISWWYVDCVVYGPQHIVQSAGSLDYGCSFSPISIKWCEQASESVGEDTCKYTMEYEQSAFKLLNRCP